MKIAVRKRYTLVVKNNSRGFTPILILAVVVVILGACYFLASQNKFFTQRLSTPLFLLASPTPGLSNGSTNSATTTGWKIIISQKLNYSIEVPKEWEVLHNESGEEFNPMFNLMTNPPGAKGESQSGLNVKFPISVKGPYLPDYDIRYKQGLNGFVKETPSEKSFYLARQTSFTTIYGKKVLIVRTINNTKPPSGAAEWCADCGQINYYIDMGDDSILPLSCIWEPNMPGIDEKLCNKILSTFKFTN